MTAKASAIVGAFFVIMELELTETLKCGIIYSTVVQKHVDISLLVLPGVIFFCYNEITLTI